MRRVIVMGPPGSGKSTLARRIGHRHGLPVFHLDQVYWQPGWVETPAALFQAEVARIAALPDWVIDGNYADTLAPRLARADTLIYLDRPNWLCLPAILLRTARNWRRLRAGGPPSPERFDAGFLRFAWNWNRLRRERHLAVVAAFPGRRMVLRHRPGLRDMAWEDAPDQAEPKP